MQLREIEAFRAVMLSGSATAAAAMLRLTQPTISKLISQMEHSTGLRLFDRIKGRLVPRREAQTLLQQVEKVFFAMEEVGRSARQLSLSHTGQIRVAAIPALGLSFLPNVVTSFLESRLDVRATLNVRASAYIGEWVSSQQVDIGFVSDAPPAIGTITERFVEGAAAVCILPSTHKLCNKRIIKPRDVLGERFISLGRDTAFRHLIDQSFADAGVTRQTVIDTNYSSTACALVASGAGIGVVDPFSAFGILKDPNIAVRMFAPEIRFSINLIRHANSSLSVLADQFVLHARAQYTARDKELKRAAGN